jgi:hypothetical protein
MWLELAEGKLTLTVFPDVNKLDSVVFDMGARAER